MATVSISIQFFKRLDNSRPQRIEVNVAHQLQEIDLFLAKNRLVAILKQMPASVTAPVKVPGITAQQAAHNGCDGNIPAFDQQMKMVGNQRPCVTLCLALGKNLTQTTQKTVTILIVAENLPALNTASNNVMQRPRRIYSSFSRHGALLTSSICRVNIKYKGRPLFHPYPNPGKCGAGLHLNQSQAKSVPLKVKKNGV